MSFELPDLNTVPATQLLSELAERIPRVAPLWTEQNASDPGITLLEMLVWIVEATAYQANCIPFEAYLCKVRFILGVAFGADLSRPYALAAEQGLDPRYAALRSQLQAAERAGSPDFDTVREAVFEFRSTPYLASTKADIEALAKEANGYIASIHFDGLTGEEQVLEAHARYAVGMVELRVLVGDPKSVFLEYVDEQASTPISFTWCKSLTSRLVTADGPVGQVAQVVQAVRDYVSRRSLLGNPISIRSAPCLYVTVQCIVRCVARSSAEDVAGSIAQAIADWMQPYSPTTRQSALPYGVVPTEASLLSAFAQVKGIFAIDALEIDLEPPPERDESAGPGTGLGVGPLEARHFKGHRFGPGGVTILRMVRVTAKAFSS